MRFRFLILTLAIGCAATVPTTHILEMPITIPPKAELGISNFAVGEVKWAEGDSLNRTVEDKELESVLEAFEGELTTALEASNYIDLVAPDSVSEAAIISVEIFDYSEESPTVGMGIFKREDPDQRKAKMSIVLRIIEPQTAKVLLEKNIVDSIEVKKGFWSSFLEEAAGSASAGIVPLGGGLSIGVGAKARKLTPMVQCEKQVIDSILVQISTSVETMELQYYIDNRAPGLLQGFQQVQGGDPKRAVRTFELIAEEHPNPKINPKAWYNLGLVYMQMQEFDHARTAFQKGCPPNLPHVCTNAIKRLDSVIAKSYKEPLDK